MQKNHRGEINFFTLVAVLGIITVCAALTREGYNRYQTQGFIREIGPLYSDIRTNGEKINALQDSDQNYKELLTEVKTRIIATADLKNKLSSVMPHTPKSIKIRDSLDVMIGLQYEIINGYKSQLTGETTDNRTDELSRLRSLYQKEHVYLQSQL